MANKKSPEFHRCEDCDYNTANKYDFRKHVLTGKHKKNMKKLEKGLTIGKELDKSPDHNFTKFKCKCGNLYSHQSSLCKHKKSCNLSQKEEGKDLNKLVMKLINENQKLKDTLITQNTELQKTITELIPKLGDKNSHNTINNKTKFNINLFLNEQCKDAISMNEFVEKIEISMKNLLTTKEKGIGEGVSDIIIENMNKLSLYERPMHCTDVKRETLYIKNKEWEKDDKKEQINDLLKKVENKQMKKINEWVEENPNYREDESLQAEYMNLIKECTSSLDECKDKIIKKICNVSQLN